MPGQQDRWKGTSTLYVLPCLTWLCTMGHLEGKVQVDRKCNDMLIVQLQQSNSLLLWNLTVGPSHAVVLCRKTPGQ